MQSGLQVGPHVHITSRVPSGGQPQAGPAPLVSNASARLLNGAPVARRADGVRLADGDAPRGFSSTEVGLAPEQRLPGKCPQPGARTGRRLLRRDGFTAPAAPPARARSPAACTSLPPALAGSALAPGRAAPRAAQTRRGLRKGRQPRSRAQPGPAPSAGEHRPRHRRHHLPLCPAPCPGAARCMPGRASAGRAGGAGPPCRGAGRGRGRGRGGGGAGAGCGAQRRGWRWRCCCWAWPACCCGARARARRCWARRGPGARCGPRGGAGRGRGQPRPLPTGARPWAPAWASPGRGRGPRCRAQRAGPPSGKQPAAPQAAAPGPGVPACARPWLRPGPGPGGSRAGPLRRARGRSGGGPGSAVAPALARWAVGLMGF